MTGEEPTSVCGDGQVDADEACDDGINDGGYGGCALGCGAVAPACGDGHIDEREACDDGNDIDGDGCNAGCVASGTLLWSVTIPNADLLDFESRRSGGVEVALVEPKSDTHALARFDLDGEFIDQLDLTAVDQSADFDLHPSGRFVQRGGLVLESYDSSGLALWTLPYPSAPLLTTRRFLSAVGDGGAAFAMRLTEQSMVGRVDADGNVMWELDLQGDILDIAVAPGGAVLTLETGPGPSEMTITGNGVDGGVEFQTVVPALIDLGILDATTEGVVVCWRGLSGSPTYGVAKLSSGGELDWSGSYGVRGELVTAFEDVALLENGDVVVLETSGNGLSFDMFPNLRRISGGTSVWDVVLDRGPTGIGRVREDAEGKLVVAQGRGDGVRIRRLEP